MFDKFPLILTTKKPDNKSRKKICKAADSKSKALADWFFRWTVLHQHGRCLGWRLGVDGFVVARDGQGTGWLYGPT